VTELHPFVTHDPLIRYWTDDLVELVRRPCSCGEVGFIPHGRLAMAVRDPSADSTILLSRFALLAALESVPTLRWRQRAGWMEQTYGPLPLELPCAGVEVRHADGRTSIAIDVECSFPALVYPEEVRRTVDGVRSALIARSRGVRRAVEEGRCSVEVSVSGPTVSSAPRATTDWVRIV
jgi:hypothetical protein